MPHVWISPSSNSDLHRAQRAQAQTVPLPRQMSNVRDASIYDKLVLFARVLPRIRGRVDQEYGVGCRAKKCWCVCSRQRGFASAMMNMAGKCCLWPDDNRQFRARRREWQLNPLSLRGKSGIARDIDLRRHWHRIVKALPRPSRSRAVSVHQRRAARSGISARPM